MNIYKDHCAFLNNADGIKQLNSMELNQIMESNNTI